MQHILETVMLICFGASWPLNVLKAWKARSAKGMSLPFLLLIITGYLAGIAAKLVGGQINYVLIAYVINLLMVSCNVLIYLRNRRMDRAAA